MQLDLNIHLADGYKSPSQRARRMTEGWFAGQMYCPACPSPRLEQTRGSNPVVDFLCPGCGAEFQVKAKAGPLGARLRDAAYQPMMERVTVNRSPHFAFLGYDSRQWAVRGLLLVPGHFITPDVIQKCKPLSDSARRAGWTGCNILAGRIPPDGRIAVVDQGAVLPSEAVRRQWLRFADLGLARAERRGWIVDMLRVVRSFGGRSFTLKEVYAFEESLAAAHPENRHVRDKIRQQLQFLRNRGVIRFLGRGRYVAE
jgi:type II restriction enzyme